MSDGDTMGAQFLPYRIADSGRTVDDVFGQVNEAVWYGYGPDYRAGGPTKIIAGPEFDFVSLLQDLTSLSNATFVRHWELLGTPCREDEIRIAIRHDIDSDIVAALQQAEIEASFGIAANWVVLHTAAYYGTVNEQSGTFERNDSMIEVYKRFHELGHEVSIHSDPLGLYQFHGIDGAQGFVTELEWLRSHGIDVRGSTAHNFRPTYGAENFEVFKGYVAPGPMAQPADATWVNHRGKGAPLRVLDEVALGLEYEGNQVFWREDLNLEYGSARFTNLWFWTDHRRKRNADPQILDREFLDQRRMVDEIRNMPGGTDVVLVVHPEYFGARNGHDQRPARAFDRVTAVPSPKLGWQVYEPWAVVAETGYDTEPSGERVQSSQSFNVANELGMLDTPIEARPDAERTIVIAGGANVDGRRVAVPSQFPARLGFLGVDRLSQTVGYHKVAHPTMAIDRLWGWIQAAVEDSDPDTVVIGVDASMESFGSEAWSPPADDPGLSGSYLAVRDGQVYETDYPLDSAPVDSDWPALLACCRWVIERLWDQEIRTVLLVEQPGVDAATWEAHPHRLSLQSLAAATGALLVDPTDAIDAEERRLDDLSRPAERPIWNATAHRVVSEELFAALFPQATPPEFRSNFERRREATAASVRLLPRASALAQPAEAAMADHRERAEALRIKQYPTPFVSAVSIVGDIDGSSTAFYRNYMGRLVGDLGLDHGDSIHLVGYHQRYSRGRRGLATNIRAILSYDLRRDNAAIGRGYCWLAHVLGEYHRGNIDHLHGLYAWGARTLPLTVTSNDADDGTSLASPFVGAQASPGEREPFAYNAEHFPLISVAVEFADTGAAGDVPPRVVPRYTPQPTDEGGDNTNLLQRRPDELVLMAQRHLPSGNTLATYTAPAPLLWPVDPYGVNGVVPQTDLLGIDIDVAADRVISAALHNTDSQGVRSVLSELGSRFGVMFDLITAHGRYHFYTSEALGPQMAGLESVRDERGRDKAHALFGLPSEGGAAAVAIADDPHSAAQVFPALFDAGIRYLTPCGLISRKEAIFDPLDMTLPAIDRSGHGLHYLRRTQPDCAWEPADERHGNYSRLSTFENRLQHVLDLLDAGHVGVWPIYTHLGQTSDLEQPPEPWFGDGVIEALADRYFGGVDADVARPWLTRASVLTNYATVMQALPDLVKRSRHHIEISRRVDPITGHYLPEYKNQLYGVSFEVDDPRKATVAFDGDEVCEVVRWLDRGEITLVPCGVRWPIIDRCDPLVVAGHEGDLMSAGTRAGAWEWRSESHHSSPEAEPYGRITLGDSGAGELRIELDKLDASGAQVASMRVRKGHGVDTVAVRLITEGGGVYEIFDTPQAPADESPTGRFRMVTRAGGWVEVHAPLWGFDWTRPMPTARTIRAVEIVATGDQGATVDIAGLFLGRARSAVAAAPDGRVRLGGDAVSRRQVRLTNLANREIHVCPVDPDGLWATPPIVAGAWLVDVDGQFPVAVQAGADRFDLRVEPDPDF